MLVSIVPKLPMRNKAVTQAYYIDLLGFTQLADYGQYLLLAKDEVEIHFFMFEALAVHQNYGQVYIRTRHIARYYQDLQHKGVFIHPNAPLQIKPWGQQEFSLLDPDHNLLTFGESVVS